MKPNSKRLARAVQVVVGMACWAPWIVTQASVYDFSIAHSPSSYELSTHEVIFSPGGPIKTVWDPGNASVTPTVLRSGDTLTFDFYLTSPLQVTDLASNPDASEMIYWAVGGSGSLSSAQSMNYDWQFLGTSGALLSVDTPGTGVLRPIPGQLQGVINVSQTFRTLNLTDSSFTFSGIRLSMTVPSIPADWTINTVRLDFAADDIRIVPEPVFESLGGLVLFFAAWERVWSRRGSKR